jgi:hypothetical protein
MYPSDIPGAPPLKGLFYYYPGWRMIKTKLLKKEAKQNGF